MPWKDIIRSATGHLTRLAFSANTYCHHLDSMLVLHKLVACSIAMLAVSPHVEASGAPSRGAPPQASVGVIEDMSAPSGMRLVKLNNHSVARSPASPFRHSGPSSQPLLCWAGFRDSISTEGWSYLAIYSNGSQPDELQARAAGFAEGALTHQLIWEYAENHKDEFGWSQALKDYVDANMAWMRREIAASKQNHESSNETLNESTTWWHQVSLMLAQEDGLLAGYNEHAAPGTV